MKIAKSDFDAITLKPLIKCITVSPKPRINYTIVIST